MGKGTCPATREKGPKNLKSGKISPARKRRRGGEGSGKNQEGPHVTFSARAQNESLTVVGKSGSRQGRRDCKKKQRPNNWGDKKKVRAEKQEENVGGFPDQSESRKAGRRGGVKHSEAQVSKQTTEGKKKEKDCFRGLRQPARGEKGLVKKNGDGSTELNVSEDRNQGAVVLGAYPGLRHQEKTSTRKGPVWRPLRRIELGRETVSEA